MRLQEQWRADYRSNRYGRHLTQAELNSRLRDVLVNLLTVTAEDKLGVKQVGEPGLSWWELWTHMLEEMRLRYGPYPAGFARDILRRESFPDFVGCLSKRAGASLSSHGLKTSQVFVKFGRRRHMAALHERGELRIQPASYFSDPRHLGSVRDDELSLAASLEVSGIELGRLARLLPGPHDSESHYRLDLEWRAPGDYWLYCLTTALSPRLFGDFGADACVIVHGRAAFRNRLQAAMRRALPSALGQEGAVEYVDPLLPKRARVFVPLAKHFRYAYQEEYRYLWFTGEGAAHPIQHLDLAIGPLTDAAELVAL